MLAVLTLVTPEILVAQVLRARGVIRSSGWTVLAGAVAIAVGIAVVGVALLDYSTFTGDVGIGAFVAGLFAFLVALNWFGRRAGIFLTGLAWFGVASGALFALASLSAALGNDSVGGVLAITGLLTYGTWSIWFAASLFGTWRRLQVAV